jgi:hypothetical protein
MRQHIGSKWNWWIRKERRFCFCFDTEDMKKTSMHFCKKKSEFKGK